MALARRTVVWLWLSAVGGGLLLVIGWMVLWMFLPRWAPYWVIDHCPFVEPVVRAWASAAPAPAGTPESGYGFPPTIEDFSARRLDHFGPKVVPTLLQLLDDADPDVRLHALKYLRPHGLPEVERLHDLTRDVNPWVRLAAWERLEYEPVEVRYLRPGTTGDDIATSALALLNDVDSYIRRSIVHDLSDQDSLPLSVRQALVSQVHQVTDDDSRDDLMRALSALSRRELKGDPNAKLSSEWLFPLLNLGQAPPEDADLHDFLAEQIPLVEQDFHALHAQLGAMQRGEVPWELGAHPWMYEQLNQLFSERVTLAVMEIDAIDLPRHHFPQGNVVIDPFLIAAAPPPVTLKIEDQSLVVVLTTLAGLIDARLQLRHGVTFLSSGARPWYGQVRGFVPGVTITLAPGMDPDDVAIVRWRAALKRRCSVDCRSEVVMAQFFSDLSRQSSIPIDVSAMVFSDGESLGGMYLRDLTLEQILCFIAEYLSWDQRVRVELSPAGIRMLRPGAD